LSTTTHRGTFAPHGGATLYAYFVNIHNRREAQRVVGWISRPVDDGTYATVAAVLRPETGTVHPVDEWPRGALVKVAGEGDAAPTEAIYADVRRHLTEPFLDREWTQWHAKGRACEVPSPDGVDNPTDDELRHPEADAFARKLAADLGVPVAEVRCPHEYADDLPFDRYGQPASAQ
jgi:hypothetical protein